MSALAIVIHHSKGGFQVIYHGVDVGCVQPALCPVGVDFDDEADPFVHSDRQWLGTPHLTQSGGEDKLAPEGRTLSKMGLCGSSQGLVCALQDTLGSDIDPRTSGHLAVHDQPFSLPFVKVVLSGPGRHDI